MKSRAYATVKPGDDIDDDKKIAAIEMLMLDEMCRFFTWVLTTSEILCDNSDIDYGPKELLREFKVLDTSRRGRATTFGPNAEVAQESGCDEDEDEDKPKDITEVQSDYDSLIDKEDDPALVSVIIPTDTGEPFDEASTSCLPRLYIFSNFLNLKLCCQTCK